MLRNLEIQLAASSDLASLNNNFTKNKDARLKLQIFLQKNNLSKTQVPPLVFDKRRVFLKAPYNLVLDFSTYSIKQPYISINGYYLNLSRKPTKEFIREFARILSLKPLASTNTQQERLPANSTIIKLATKGSKILSEISFSEVVKSVSLVGTGFILNMFSEDSLYAFAGCESRGYKGLQCHLPWNATHESSLVTAMKNRPIKKFKCDDFSKQPAAITYNKNPLGKAHNMTYEFKYRVHTKFLRKILVKQNEKLSCEAYPRKIEGIIIESQRGSSCPLISGKILEQAIPNLPYKEIINCCLDYKCLESMRKKKVNVAAPKKIAPPTKAKVKQ